MATFTEVLGEDLAKQVEAKITEHNAGIEDKSKQVRFTDLSEGGFISSGRFAEVQQKLQDTEKLLEDANVEIKSYKDMDIEGIKTKAAEWETKYNTGMAEMQEKLDTQQKTYAAEQYLADQGFRSNLAKKAALDNVMQLEYKDGAFVGADDLLKKLKEEDPESFVQKEEKKKGPESWMRATGQNKPKPMTVSDEKAYLDGKYKNNKYYGK